MKILVAVDLSDSTPSILKTVQHLYPDSRVWLLHVVEQKPELLAFDKSAKAERDFLAERFRGEHQRMQALSEQLRSAGIEATSLLLEGETDIVILAEAARHGVDVVVVGSHGRGMMAQMFVGSVSQAVLKSGNCPVLVVPVGG